MKKIIKYFFLAVFVIFILAVGYFFIGKAKPADKISWGINFSQTHAEKLGLDWKKTYLALLDVLGAKELKIATYWDLIEKNEGKYNFDDLDWQIEKAREKRTRVLLVIGMKTPRWPECHIPEWAKNLKKQKQQEKIVSLLEKIVLRYKEEPAIWAWQVENEPFFAFGECPWTDKDFLEREIELVKSLDPQKRPVVITDTGEWSLWLRAANSGDIVGTTTYRTAWFKQLGFSVKYYFPAVFYQRRAKIIKTFFGKEVIGIELQAEPWGYTWLYELPLEEQLKSMNLERFRDNIDFAKKTGLKEFYFWGAEWWYWLKTKNNMPEIWEEAQKYF